MDGKNARDERKKQRELELGRKAGLIPHELDEDGNAINPHIPQFMASAPWYLNQDAPGLKHQKAPKKEEESREWYQRGVTTTKATKFRKGACENCGAMTHKRKDCMERPRKIGAKKSSKDIAADEYVQPDLKLGFESKRDRYNGFDADDYSRVVERYEAADALKQKLAKQKELERAFRRANKKEGEVSEGDDSDDDSSSDDDDAKVADAAATGFTNIKRAVRAPGGGASGTVRNLRLREDTAKYLRNLDVDSAYYDPKTRSMRENPTPNADPADNFFRGDNAHRLDGQVVEFERMNRHAWESSEAGTSGIHVQAAPSQAEALFKQFKEKKEKLATQNKVSIMDKYGDASAGKALPDGLALGQTEQYVEYDRAGRIINGNERPVIKSCYEEDVYLQNHTSVWGSYWCDGSWGYACCRQMVKPSYCTGAQGIEAAHETTSLMVSNVENKRAIDEANAARSKASLLATKTSKDLWGGDVKDDVELDPKKLVEALKRHDDEQLRKNKRGYNASHEEQVTQEDMEAYRMKKRAFEDPMANPNAKSADGYDMV